MSLPLQRLLDRLSEHARLILLRMALGFGFVVGLAISLVCAYLFDTTLWPVIDNYRVSSAVLKDDILTISGEMTMARNCRMNYIAFYGEDSGLSGSSSLAHYERDKVMALTHTIDYGQGQVPFGPIVVPVPGASRHEWLTIVSSHDCHPFWTHVTKLTTLYVPSIRVPR